MLGCAVGCYIHRNIPENIVTPNISQCKNTTNFNVSSDTSVNMNQNSGQKTKT